ncbi:MAG: LiaF transmembrane domain-containing protein [Actinomycetota bacterium]
MIDRVSAGAGVFFVVAGVLFLLDGLEVISVGAAWLWPGLLIALGAALVLAGRGRGS